MEKTGNWRKARASMANGNCVEVGDWRTARASFANGNCVEAGSARGGVVVRDTVDRGSSVLRVPGPAWREFTARVRAGLPSR